MSESVRRPILMFAAVAAICAVFVGAYALYTTGEPRHAAEESPVEIIESAETLPTIVDRPRALFRNSAIGKGHGRLALVPLQSSAGPRWLTSLSCERVDFAGGTGVCLHADRGFTATYTALLFDRQLKVTRTVPLKGIPSRTRVAPNGQLAAITVFVSGHSYAGGDFSTATTLVDTRDGRELADLEQFAVTRDGSPFKAVDFNFWGVTFAADSNRFYATLATERRFLLVEGDAAQRRARVIRDGVECPSLSPDGRRIAFKKRVPDGSRLVWRLAVMDLGTLHDRVLPGETRSIDDQVEWLNDSQLVYGVIDDAPGLGGTSVWVVGVDDAQPARPWIKGAFSPSIAR